MVDVIGRIVSGDFGEIFVRQKNGEEIEIGDLIISGNKDEYTILQVTNLLYGSQLPKDVMSLMAGMKLEGHGKGLVFMDPTLSNFITAELKSLVTVKKEVPVSPKKLPEFFSELRRITAADLQFIGMPEKPLHVGKIRSGSKILDVDINLPGEKILKHHVLISASTGKGKSNLVKVMSYNALDKDYCGMLILDPHNEYFGKDGIGLSGHPKSGERLRYYTPSEPPAGQNTLSLHINKIRPWHLGDVMNLSEAQQEAVYAFYHKFGATWIESLVSGGEVTGVQPITIIALQRKMNVYLGLTYENEQLTCSSIFRNDRGESTIKDICDALEAGKAVIIDTSYLDSREEILIGAIISQNILNRYKNYKSSGNLSDKPIVSIVIEEAPRVLGVNSVIKSGNIFETIAREGRKFKIGLIAITQLPSVIPREILANMNTKIILGTEMSSDRKSIIDSASQDLSKDDRTIASLDIGEAIVSSTFTRFAVPINIPLFEDLLPRKDEKKVKRKYTGTV